jgi:ketosteroid isomerase-like protein
VDEPTGGSQRSAEIDEGRASFADAIRKGDLHAAASAYTENARLLPPAAELIEGRKSIAAFWQAGLDAGVVDVEHEALAVRRRDRIAYEVGRYVLQLRLSAGGTVVDRGTYVVVLEQEADGSWRRAVEMFNPGPDPREKGGRMAPRS